MAAKFRVLTDVKPPERKVPKDFSKSEDPTEVIEFNWLSRCLQGVLTKKWQGIDFTLLANTLLTLRKRFRGGSQDGGTSYAVLVDYLTNPEDRRGSQRRYMRLVQSLAAEGFLRSSKSGERIMNIGPRLFEASRIIICGDIIGQWTELARREEIILLSNFIAPYHQHLLQGNPITFTEDQVREILRLYRFDEDKRSEKEFMKDVRIIKQAVQSKVLVKITSGSPGKPALYALREPALIKQAWEESKKGKVDTDADAIDSSTTVGAI